jgi:hypothetical protein
MALKFHTNMQIKHSLLAVFMGVALAFTACKKKDNDDNSNNNNNNNNNNSSKEIVEVTSNITGNVTWKSDKIYVIKKYIYVDSLATLTIEPGTIIKGDKNEAANTKGALIVKRGGRLIADGTVDKPIVFTSNKEKGMRNVGDWGGVWICGSAPTNAGTNVPAEADLGVFFGGNNPNDNSGILRYVRIEFGGIALQPNKEINGLTLAGVGSSTVIENVQVSFAGDDAFEWFGGNVNAKRLISYKNIDDDLDMDNGFSGKIQYVLVVRDANLADVSGSNGFEIDNDASGSQATPSTRAIVSNVTIVGPHMNDASTYNADFKRAAHLRRSSKINIYNSVFAGFPIGILIDGDSTAMYYNTGEAHIRNCVVSSWKGSDSLKQTTTNYAFDVHTWFNNSAFNNSFVKNFNDLQLNASQNYVPNAGSPLLNGGSTTVGYLNGDNFFTNETFRGAFGSTNWASGWANFDPQNTEYK